MSQGMQLLWALALGGSLGLCYDFLRPGRIRCNAPADLIFVAAMGVAWLQFNFGICGGSIRFFPNFVMALGFGL